VKISPEEQAAIRTVVELGQRHGYGNLISHLQTAWAARLIAEWNMDESGARLASGGAGYPFLMQKDLIERGEWDESGARYRPEDLHDEPPDEAQNG
jgi:hypothetical protein